LRESPHRKALNGEVLTSVRRETTPVAPRTSAQSPGRPGNKHRWQPAREFPAQHAAASSKATNVENVLQCLRRHGQCLDLDIASEIQLPLDDVRRALELLVKGGHAITCKLTRFERGKPTEALQCRVAGYIPKPAPGRKGK
jgi:hypothetical protein